MKNSYIHVRKTSWKTDDEILSWIQCTYLSLKYFILLIIQYECIIATQRNGEPHRRCHLQTYRQYLTIKSLSTNVRFSFSPYFFSLCAEQVLINCWQCLNFIQDIHDFLHIDLLFRIFLYQDFKTSVILFLQDFCLYLFSFIFLPNFDSYFIYYHASRYCYSCLIDAC